MMLSCLWPSLILITCLCHRLSVSAQQPIEDVGFPPPNIYHRRDSPDGGDRLSYCFLYILEDYRLRLCRWTREREKSLWWPLFGMTPTFSAYVALAVYAVIYWWIGIRPKNFYAHHIQHRGGFNIKICSCCFELYSTYREKWIIFIV